MPPLYPQFRNLSDFTFCYPFVNEFLSVLINFALVRSLGLHIGLGEMMLIVPMIILTGVVPITINNLGLREGAFVVLFTALGVTSSQAFVVAVLSRIGLLLPGVVGGVLYGLSGQSLRTNADVACDAAN